MSHKHLTRALLRLVPAMLLSAAALSAAPLDRWHWRSPLPQGNPLRSIAFGNGLYVAVGDLGTILTSPDGTNWVRQASGITAGLRDCAYGAGIWVVVGDFGTVLTSSDAQAWTLRFPGTFFSLNAITYGGAGFVAAGNATTVITSTDGISWTPRSSGPWDLFDVIYEEGVYIAVGGDRGSANAPSSGVILTSTDSVMWSRRSPPTEAALLSIAYGGGTFAAAAQSSFSVTPALWVSEDGYSWAPQNINVIRWPDARIGYGDGVWVLAGSHADSVYFEIGAIAISTNLQSWSQVMSNTAASAIIHEGGNFLLSRTDGTILLSTDARAWTNPHQQQETSRWTISDLEYVNGGWLGVAYDRLIFSRDGNAWTDTAVFTNDNFFTFAHGAGAYVVGSSDQLWTSRDLVNWTNATPTLPDPLSLADITFGNGLFVAVSSYYGQVLTSRDGLKWSGSWLSEPAYLPLQGIAYGNGRFVAVGFEALATTLDGTNWHVVQTNVNMSRVTWGNGRFVAVGRYGSMITRDGTNWMSQSVPQFGVSAVGYGGGHFVAVGIHDSYSRFEAPIWVSTDGLTWSRRSSNSLRGLSSVAFGDGTFLVGGRRGLVLQSDPIVSLTMHLNSEPQLTLSGPIGRSYRIDYADSPHAIWRPLRSVLLDADSVTVSDPQAAPTRFYRAVLLQ